MNAMGIAVEENNFPAGMRVLAVDDDPTSLKILENLLQKCQYNVTTTTDAKTALDRLRENPDNFDLVVTDVKMPNMDGFKLLELVGHEMNLPVIMLSVDDNPGLVLEGIKNGACDYLVKPVRIEELKNIWQHVYRKRFNLRRKGHSTALVNFDQGAENGGQQHVPYGHEEQNRKRTREWNGEGEGIDPENRPEIDESGNPKKHRVVWSMDLHDKFVVAVNQLGMERAVPKSILELMNVEGLTRENVASHLQKYRQYLRRRDEANGHQGNVAPQFGRNINPYDGLADFGALARARRYSSPYISPSYQQGGILGTAGSFSNPARIPYGNTALQHAIHSYSENAMFQPVGLQPVALPTIPSTNHSRDPTLYTSAIPLATVGASLGTSGNFSVRPSGNPSSQFFQSEAATLGRLPHMQYNPQDFSSVNAVNQTPELNWGEHTQVYAPMQNQLYSPGSGVMGPSSKNFNQNNSFRTWR